MNLQAMNKWHKTRTGHLIFGLVELGLAYLFASLAIDSGSLLQYAATFILLIGGIQNFVNVFRTPNNEHKKH